jgi:peptide/nickel transport system substrate-binding protein
MRRLTGRQRIWVSLLVTCSVGVAACGGSGQPAPSQSFLSGGTLTIRALGDFQSFDPQGVFDDTTNAMAANAYATLLYLDPKGRLNGYLAKSWKATVSSVTFTLKSGVTCSDGTPLTPTVVKDSMQRMIGSKNSYNRVLFGPGPYTATADDAAGTFTFSVGTPNGDLVYAFIQNFPSSLTGVICPAGLKDPSQLRTKMFGAGPYTLVEANHADHVTFKLRPEFNWGPLGVTAKSPGVASTVIYKIVGADTTAANLLLTGGVNLGQVLGPDVDRLIPQQSLTRTETLNSYAMQNLAFNETTRIGSDETIRRALITAIDPKGWAQGSVNGHGVLSSNFVAPGTNCFDTSTAKFAPKPSVTDARKILTDAGWTFSNGKLSKDGQPLKFTFLGSPTHNAGPEYLGSQWTNMGADVNVFVPDNSTYVKRLESGNTDVGIIAGVVTIPAIGPAAQRISGPPPPNGTNYLRITDQVLDSEALAAAQVTGAESCKHWATFQEELWKKWHMLPLVSPYVETFAHKVDVSMAIGPAGRDTTPIMAKLLA